MPRNETVLLYVGLRGTVLALERESGTERWRAKLKGMSFVSLHRDDRFLYAATGGELFCLDPATGSVVWQNKLKGMGFGLVSLLSEAARSAAGAPESSTSYVTVAEEMKRRQTHAHGGGAG